MGRVDVIKKCGGGRMRRHEHIKGAVAIHAGNLTDKGTLARESGSLGKGNISLGHLSKRYHNVVAVDDLCLDVQEGEFLTLLGPSGSGKSTTLMMIAGFIDPTSGDILLGSSSIVGLPPHRRDMGIVFQQNSLFPHLDVFRNVAFPLEMRSVPRSEIATRVEAAMELVRLSGFQDRRPSQLSGGQQQRVALARALVFRPRVLLLDEPLGPLDLRLRQELQKEIKRIHEELGVTVIFVTHDQGEALSMSDRIAVMTDGRLQQVGTPGELYEKPANLFVATFIGESNFLTARLLKGHDSVAVFETHDGLRLTGHTNGERFDPCDVTLILRPESIVPADERTTLANRFDGIVEDLVYLGEVTKYMVRIGPDTVVTAHWQRRAGIPNLRRGERTRIGWSEADLLALHGASERSSSLRE